MLGVLLELLMDLRVLHLLEKSFLFQEHFGLSVLLLWSYHCLMTVVERTDRHLCILLCRLMRLELERWELIQQLFLWTLRGGWRNRGWRSRFNLDLIKE